jgi:nucleoside-diphosphate-sugar epimerase
VRAIRAAGAAPGIGGRAYNVGGGAPVSLNSALETIAGLAGRPLDVQRSGRESGDVLHTAADVSRARRELRFAPATALADGLAAEFAWVSERASRDARPRRARAASRA